MHLCQGQSSCGAAPRAPSATTSARRPHRIPLIRPAHRASIEKPSSVHDGDHAAHVFEFEVGAGSDVHLDVNDVAAEEKHAGRRWRVVPGPTDKPRSQRADDQVHVRPSSRSPRSASSSLMSAGVQVNVVVARRSIVPRSPGRGRERSRPPGALRRRGSAVQWARGLEARACRVGGCRAPRAPSSGRLKRHPSATVPGLRGRLAPQTRPPPSAERRPPRRGRGGLVDHQQVGASDTRPCGPRHPRLDVDEDLRVDQRR